MTSGVRQALPQILMQQSNAGLKGRNARVPQENFAEALGIGKSARQMKTDDAKADQQKEAHLSTWSHLTAKLDAAGSHAERTGRNTEVEKTEIQSETDKVNAAEDVQSSGTRAPEQVQPPIPASPRPTVASQTEPVEQKPVTFSSRGAQTTIESDKKREEGNAFVSRASEARQGMVTSPSFVPMGRTEPESMRVEQTAAQPATNPADQLQAVADDVLQEASPEPAKAVPRVTVIAQQSIPSPMPSTSLTLVETIAASDLLDPANTRSTLEAIHTSATHSSAQSLKLQLHPAELGMVTATLRFAGEQLSIELQVENHEAYRRLASDSDTIISSLRKLGYEIDGLTVLQPQIAAPPAARSDAATPMSSSQARPGGEFGSGSANGGSSGSGGRAPGGNENSGHGGHRDAPPRKEGTGSGLYI